MGWGGQIGRLVGYNDVSLLPLDGVWWSGGSILSHTSWQALEACSFMFSSLNADCVMMHSPVEKDYASR